MYVPGCIGVGNWRYSIPLPLTQGAETYLLRQQSFGGRRNKVFKDGANGLGPSKCRPEAPPLLPSPPGGRANRPAPSQHPAQVGPNRKNASMGHRVERIWNRVPTQVVRERPSDD